MKCFGDSMYELNALIIALKLSLYNTKMNTKS